MPNCRGAVGVEVLFSNIFTTQSRRSAKMWTGRSRCVGEQACQNILKHFVVFDGVFARTSTWNQ